jgi:hypothetical protein
MNFLNKKMHQMSNNYHQLPHSSEEQRKIDRQNQLAKYRFELEELKKSHSGLPHDHQNMLMQVTLKGKIWELEFQGNTHEELIDSFNKLVGLRNWGFYISIYVEVLTTEIQSREFDSSIIFSIDEAGRRRTSLNRKVVLRGNQLEFE